MSGIRPTLRWAALGCCLVLLAAGCGTRLTRAQILAQNETGLSSASGGGSGGQLGSGGGLDSGAGTGPAGVSGGVGGSGASGASGGSVAAGAGANSSAGSGTKVGSSSGAGSGTTGAATPIVIGYIGYLSGFGATTGIPPRNAWQAWTRMINASGGINGHPIKLLVGDDGGTTSADASLAQQFVQNDGAVALSWASTDPSAIGAFAKSHSVPVVGAELGGIDWYQNPFMFPEGPDGRAGPWGIARLSKDDLTSAGKPLIVGSVVCVEAPAVCTDTQNQYAKYAQGEGLQDPSGNQFQVSLTQPDYTPTCLSARGNNIQLLYMALDDNSMIRFAQSCSRQGYNPVYAIGITDDAMASNPLIAGSISASASFPWFLRSGSPALDEYGHAMQLYDPAEYANGSTTLGWGWQSAKVFQDAANAATAHLKPTDKVTSQDILNGLWSLKGDTVSGLDPGPMARTYTQGQPTDLPFCVFSEKVAGGRWTAPQGMTPLCR